MSHRVWQQSGHWDHYRDNMFILDIEGQPYSLKPMNCPESTFIYRSRLRSYRDLPLRYAEYGRLHRNELSGALSGLTRVRQFIQDDGHVYVRPDQLQAEIASLLGMIREAYGWFGLEPRYAFATRPDGAIGDPALWDRAEGYIKAALERPASLHGQAEGRHVLRAEDRHLHRRRPRPRMADGDDPGRPDDAARAVRPDVHRREGKPQRPIAIHRAIYGSLERFIGILVEHFGGAFPIWVAPVQAVDHPHRRPPHRRRRASWPGVLRERGLRVEVDDSSNRMQYKIRTAQEQKVPYMLVLGDREIEARSATVRRRGAAQGRAAGDRRLGGPRRPLAAEVAARGVRPSAEAG